MCLFSFSRELFGDRIFFVLWALRLSIFGNDGQI
jgi:hypothetical protein